MLCRIIEQHRHRPFDCYEITDEERDRARRDTEGVAQRNRMIDGSSVLQNPLRDAHGLIGKSLKPEDPRKKDTPRHPLVKQKEDGMRPAIGGHIATDLALHVTRRAGLVPKVMQRDPGHSVADQPISRVGAGCSKTAEPLSKRQRRPMLAAADAKRE